MSAADQRLGRLLDSLPDGVLSFDAQGRIEWMNPAARLMFQCSAYDAPGRAVADLIPALPQLLVDACNPSLALPEGRGLVHRHTVAGVRLDGSEFPLEVTLTSSGESSQAADLCVCRDMTDAHRVEQIKHEFVSMVSHELRTPLTSLRAALALLTDGTMGPYTKDVQHLLGLASHDGERLVRLVNDILDYEKLRAGALSIQLEAVDLLSILAEGLRASAGMALSTGVNVRMVASSHEALGVASREARDTGEGDDLGDGEHSSAAIAVQADPRRLEQVLVNLISNAIKHSPPGGAVLITVNAGDDRVRVCITDEGPGVSAAFLPRLFEPFAQARESEACRKKGGSGLGLAISRDLMHRMNGGIGLAPSRPGAGATFWIDLPLDREPVGTFFQTFV